MIPKRHQPQEEGTDAWLMSYADMITLLMCFFVIFVSVSEPKKERISAITDGMAGRFGTVDMTTPFAGVIRSLNAIVEGQGLVRDIAIEPRKQSVVMELATKRFFKPATAEFEAGEEAVLSEIATAIKAMDPLEYSVAIESHTSNAAPKGGPYRTNWELSAGRAAKLAELLAAHGIPSQRIIPSGMGEVHPKVPNEDSGGVPIPENREKNERIIMTITRL